MNLFRTLIVTAADAPLARSIASAFGPGGVGMWRTPLSANGQEPATHYISSGCVPAQFASLDTDSAAIAAIVAQAGVTATAQEIGDAISRSDFTTEPPFTAMARLGLKIINPTET